MATPQLSEAIDNLIFEAWQQGKTQQACFNELNGAATLRQIQLRYNKFETQATLQPGDVELDPLARDLLDPQLDSETKESILLKIMEAQIARLNLAAQNPRKVAIDMKAERLLGERADSLLRAYRERPYEVG